MNKCKKSIISLFIILSLILSMCSISYAGTSYVPSDGNYTISVNTDVTGPGKMFYIASEDNKTCKLNVDNGVMTATIRLNGSGYDKLFLGTAKEAEEADPTKLINYVEDDDMYYTFTLPVSQLNKELAVAAYGTQGKAWHDHTIIFYYNTPEKTYLKKLSTKKSAVTVTWSKQQRNTTGYQIQYARNTNFKSSKIIRINKNSTTSLSVKGLSKGKKYYFRIRTINKANSNTFYSSWSSKKSIIIK